MRKYVAEFIGTAILVLLGCGSAVAANTLISAMGMLPVAFTTLLIAVAFGLALTAVMYALGDVSGAHVNPAVSLSFLITKRMTGKDFAGYVIAQILGGTVGALLLAFFLGGTASLASNGYGSLSTFGISLLPALIMEIILTFVFVLVVLMVTDKAEHKSIAGVVIGGAYALVHLFGVPFTGTSVNPARSIGPALVQALSDTSAIIQVWVFILGPLVGGAIAAALYIFFKNEKDDEEDSIDIPLEALTEEEIEEIKAIGEENGVQVDLGSECSEDCQCDECSEETVEETVDETDEETVDEAETVIVEEEKTEE